MSDESGTSIRRFEEPERDPSEIHERYSDRSGTLDIADLGTPEPKGRPSESLRNSSCVGIDQTDEEGNRSTKVVRVSEQS